MSPARQGRQRPRLERAIALGAQRGRRRILRLECALAQVTSKLGIDRRIAEQHEQFAHLARLHLAPGFRCDLVRDGRWNGERVHIRLRIGEHHERQHEGETKQARNKAHARV